MLTKMIGLTISLVMRSLTAAGELGSTSSEKDLGTAFEPGNIPGHSLSGEDGPFVPIYVDIQWQCEAMPTAYCCRYVIWPSQLKQPVFQDVESFNVMYRKDPKLWEFYCRRIPPRRTVEAGAKEAQQPSIWIGPFFLACSAEAPFYVRDVWKHNGYCLTKPPGLHTFACPTAANQVSDSQSVQYPVLMGIWQHSDRMVIHLAHRQSPSNKKIAKDFYENAVLAIDSTLLDPRLPVERDHTTPRETTRTYTASSTESVPSDPEAIIDEHASLVDVTSDKSADSDRALSRISADILATMTRLCITVRDSSIAGFLHEANCGCFSSHSQRKDELRVLPSTPVAVQQVFNLHIQQIFRVWLENGNK